MNTSFERPYRPVDLNTSAGDVLHSVYANEDSAFLVVIGGKQPK